MNVNLSCQSSHLSLFTLKPTVSSRLLTLRFPARLARSLLDAYNAIISGDPNTDWTILFVTPIIAAMHPSFSLLTQLTHICM